ncbi:exosortase family protein XrtF [Fulvivirga sediminis]|uniref:Exosortase family protein XrtF n=1 Tax=Fulvivirga sediminis TaxID=2803949 RepID=A0A937JY70_9BACT|nr:exosortase family protein XrtF [Fulvivirga sediminis]MBL3655374.1 exosortase family protein XrtF [Fulvivirga sediminis]
MNISEFKPAILFIVKFLVLYLGLNLLYGFYIDTYSPSPDPITVVVTNQVSGVMSAFGNGVEASDNQEKPSVFLSLNGYNILSVYEGCNGLNVMIVFLVFLLSYGKPIKKLYWFIPMGLVGVHLFNLIRIILLFWVAQDFPEMMYFAHKYLFTAFLYIIVFLMWFWWVVKLYKLPSEET